MSRKELAFLGFVNIRSKLALDVSVLRTNEGMHGCLHMPLCSSLELKSTANFKGKSGLSLGSCRPRRSLQPYIMTCTITYQLSLKHDLQILP